MVAARQVASQPAARSAKAGSAAGEPERNPAVKSCQGPLVETSSRQRSSNYSASPNSSPRGSARIGADRSGAAKNAVQRSAKIRADSADDHRAATKPRLTGPWRRVVSPSPVFTASGCRGLQSGCRGLQRATIRHFRMVRRGSRGPPAPRSARPGSAARRRGLRSSRGRDRPSAGGCPYGPPPPAGSLMGQKIFRFLLKSVDGSTDDGTIDSSAIPLTAEGASP